MALGVSPVPIQAQVLEALGKVSRIWGDWFRDFLKASETLRSDVDDIQTEVDRYRRCRAAADLSTTSDSAGDATGLSLSLAANETIDFVFHLQTTCNNTGGIKYAFTFPSGATFRATVKGTNTSGGTTRLDVITLTATPTTGAFNLYNGADAPIIVGTITNGSTPGTLQLQFASATAGQTSVIKKGSFGRGVAA